MTMIEISQKLSEALKGEELSDDTLSILEEFRSVLFEEKTIACSRDSLAAEKSRPKTQEEFNKLFLKAWEETKVVRERELEGEKIQPELWDFRMGSVTVGLAKSSVDAIEGEFQAAILNIVTSQEKYAFAVNGMLLVKEVRRLQARLAQQRVEEEQHLRGMSP